jgi:hypothetical protein
LRPERANNNSWLLDAAADDDDLNVVEGGKAG